jgi:hypothetical protein
MNGWETSILPGEKSFADYFLESNKIETHGKLIRQTPTQGPGRHARPQRAGKL